MRDIATKLVRKLRARAGNSQFIDISDDYVNWLCFANAGMLHRGNLYCFDYAIRNLPSQSPIVEIGSFCGLSANLLTYYKQRHGKSNPLITSDKWQFEGAQDGRSLGDSSILHADYRAFVKETYGRNIQMFSRDDLPCTVEMLSDEFFDAWRSSAEVVDILGRPLRLGGPLSFCYIDGNHSYEYARRDFENCDEFLEGGGFVLFDDSADGSGWEVCEVVAEVLKSNRYELVIKNPNYLFRKR
ncbi:MAG TPA: class I SAM-dependent methyltransferase [Pyrinomonadaceae bacterium]|nr:class I SAM-dependent methyltransferase [Pyrinomonadaceae bacterium]